MNLLVLLPLIVTVSGTYMLFCLDFMFVIHPFRMIEIAKNELSEKESRISLSLALAGTLGVGNIVGVAVGISVGGAGSVFWLLLSTVFSSVLKFSEAALSAYFKDGGNGGMMYIIKNSFTKIGKRLSYIYAMLCICLSFCMGAALQSSSVGEVGEAVFESNWLLYLCFIIFFIIIAKKGKKTIEVFTSRFIPISTVLFICLALYTIISKYHNIPFVFKRIIYDAFSSEGGCGGVIGFFTSGVVREGFCRGLLSNEAGAGTSTLAHAINKSKDPFSVGIMGVCEVLFDTVILCPLTAFSILVCVPEPLKYNSGVTLLIESLGNSLGSFSKIILVVLVFVFAFSTVICWYYYGSECRNYLFNEKGKFLYFVLFLISVIYGFLSNVEWIVLCSDYILLFLTVISTSAVIKNSDNLKKLSENVI